MEDKMSQKGNKTWVGRSQERCGKKIKLLPTELKPALETGQREICNVEESRIRDMECTNDKSNKSKSPKQS